MRFHDWNYTLKRLNYINAVADQYRNLLIVSPSPDASPEPLLSALFASPDPPSPDPSSVSSASWWAVVAKVTSHSSVTWISLFCYQSSFKRVHTLIVWHYLKHFQRKRDIGVKSINLSLIIQTNQTSEHRFDLKSWNLLRETTGLTWNSSIIFKDKSSPSTEHCLIRSSRSIDSPESMTTVTKSPIMSESTVVMFTS